MIRHTPVAYHSAAYRVFYHISIQPACSCDNSRTTGAKSGAPNHNVQTPTNRAAPWLPSINMPCHTLVDYHTHDSVGTNARQQIIGPPTNMAAEKHGNPSHTDMYLLKLVVATTMKHSRLNRMGMAALKNVKPHQSAPQIVLTVLVSH